MSSQWTYLIADLRTNKVLAELPLSGVDMTKRVGEAGSMSATLTLNQKIVGDPYTLTPTQVVTFSRTTARPARTKYLGPSKRVAVSGPRYVIASTDDLTPQAVAGTDAGATASYAAALAAMRAEVARNPARREQLQVVAWERAVV